MQVFTNLTFDGNCEEAFAVYARVLGGTVTFALRYAIRRWPATCRRRGAARSCTRTLTLPDGGRLFGSDTAPGTYEPATRLLADHQPARRGYRPHRVRRARRRRTRHQPLEATFWAGAFGTLVDRFGVPWAINCEAAADSGPAPADRRHRHASRNSAGVQFRDIVRIDRCRRRR